MIFTRRDAYHQQSDCDRFVIAAYCVCGKWKFAATDIKREPHKLLGIVDSAEKARVLCEQTVVKEAA